MDLTYSFGVWLMVLMNPSAVKGLLCPSPATDVNTRVDAPALSPGSVATYSCDLGYDIFGERVRVCSQEGTWSGKIPTCATNVAWRKPVNQSSTARGGAGENANDGDKSTVHDGNKCAQTSVEESPWWAVDLLQKFEVSIVRITTRGCCGQEPINDLEIRVGDSPELQRNRLCAWVPGALEEGTTKELACARPIRGRYVFLQMAGIKGSLSLCEVEVFSREQFSKDRCKGDINVKTLGIFNQTCYEFQVATGGSFDSAKHNCQNLRQGNLVNNITPITQKYLVSELERHRDDMKTSMVWIGVQREPDLISRTWRWIDGSKVKKPSWGRDQPNNYNGEQNCVVLDGGRKWLWNDVGCNLNYLSWICQFAPFCGFPDKKENTTVSVKHDKEEMSASYSCPIGNKVMGEQVRDCLSTGHWSGESPSCKYFDCGEPEPIENGDFNLTDQRTSYAAKVIYICKENYTLNGSDARVCGDQHKWQPGTPQCLYSWCPELDSPKYGHITSSGRRSGDTASFKCEDGYFLIGQKVVSCMLGGKWSDQTPKCKFVDCGLPEILDHGQMTLLNETTYLESEAIYKCNDDYMLHGLKIRRCDESGYWTGEKPSCKLINCGEPEIPVGGYAIGAIFDVNSEVQYHCEEGYFMTGKSKRICLNTEIWSGEAPKCTYVDCKSPIPVIKGTITYLGKDKATYLGSEINYECSSNYKLTGPERRTCQKNGQWSGRSPRCQEIRCPPPEQPEHGVASVPTGDRRLHLPISRGRLQRGRNTTHQVGTQITYRCIRGYAVQGTNIRTCLVSGLWSDLAPSCQYVNCGLPTPVPNGSYKLLSNDTSVGASVLYECQENYRISNIYRRQCQENGSWSGEEPKCAEVLCPSLSDELARRFKDEDDRPKDSLSSDMLQLIQERKAVRIEVNDAERRISTSAIYSCRIGQKINGIATRQCLQHGVWAGREPKCDWITCEKPRDVENGRIHISTVDVIKYGAVVEYFCFPEFRLEGSFNRTCNHEGNWTGKEPICMLGGPGTGIFDDNTVDGTLNYAAGPADGELEDASYTGIYAGIAVSIILIIVVAIAFLFMRTRQRRVTKDESSSTTRFKSTSLETPAVATYGDLNDPTTGNNIYEHIPEDVEVSSYGNMSPTSSYSVTPPARNHSNSSHHTYSNSSQNGISPCYVNNNEASELEGNNRTHNHHTNGGIPYHISKRPRMPPPQPPGQPGVTVNGVAVSSSIT